MQADLQPCAELDHDLAILESWALILARPNELGETLTINYMKNKGDVKAAIDTVGSDWDSELYFKAGQDFADLSVILIGDAPKEIVDPVLPTVDVHMVNYLIAGFIYGLVEVNDLAAIEACYAGGKTIEQEIVLAIHDFKAGGWNYIT